MVANLEDSSVRRTEPLLIDRAQPDIYRKNSFRLSELPIDAETREISKRQQMLDMADTTGIPAPPGPGRALPLDANGESGTVREAMQRLREPTHRIIDELFWFWPHALGQSRNDPALAALAAGKASEAEQIWKRQESSSVANVSMHNLAVLAHVRVLDAECDLLEGRATRADGGELAKNWKSSMRRWQVLSQHEDFWSRLTERIRDIDDARLSTGTARRIRGSLPVALLLINARLAIRYFELGMKDHAKRHVEIINTSGFESEHVDEALKNAVQPTRQRISMLCKNFKAEADADAKHADKVVDRLLDQSAEPLELLDTLLGEKNPTRTVARDEVAGCALSCQISYGNQTEDWDGSLILLRRIKRVAAGETTRDRIQENIEIVERNLEFQREYGTCWYCGKNKPTDEKAFEVKMYGNVVREPVFGTNTVRVRWNSAAIQIPRCGDCASAHSRSDTILGIGALLGIVSAIAFVIYMGMTEDLGEDGWIGLLIGGFIGGAIWTALLGWLFGGIGNLLFVRPFGRKIESNYKGFSRVRELMSQGWEFGEGPSEQQS